MRGLDTSTGEVTELPGLADRERVLELEAEIERLREIQEIEREDYRKLHARHHALIADRNKGKQLSPFYSDARDVFELWKALLSPKAREFNGDRLDNVLARLKAGHSKDDLFQAVRGCAARPYVTDSGRSGSGRKDERQVELGLICRTEAHLKRFQSYAEGAPEPAAAAEVAAPTPEPVVLRAPEIEVVVPDWPVRCRKGCNHERMLRGIWWIWQAAGMAGCPGCGYDVEPRP